MVVISMMIVNGFRSYFDFDKDGIVVGVFWKLGWVCWRYKKICIIRYNFIGKWSEFLVVFWNY